MRKLFGQLEYHKRQLPFQKIKRLYKNSDEKKTLNKIFHMLLAYSNSNDICSSGSIDYVWRQ